MLTGFSVVLHIDIYRQCASSSSFLACNSRLRSTIRRHHPPQRAVLSQICCFGERKMVMLQILLDGAEPRDAGTTQLSSPVSCTYKQTHIKLCESVELLGHIRTHTRSCAIPCCLAPMELQWNACIIANYCHHVSNLQTDVF